MSKYSSAKHYQKTKKKKQEYGIERYINLPEDEKQRLFEYRKQYYKNGKIKQLQKQILNYLS